MTRGSLWDELEEPLDELEPGGGFELDDPDCEPDAPACEPDDPEAPAEDEADVPPDEPDLLDVDELDEDAGLAGVPSFVAMSNGPLTPGPKYFAVRS